MKVRSVAIGLVASTLLLVSCGASDKQYEAGTAGQSTRTITTGQITNSETTGSMPSESDGTTYGDTSTAEQKENRELTIEKVIQFDKGSVTRSVQGMSIYDGKLFQLYHTGLCNVYDLASGSQYPIASFALGSLSEQNHANSCNFSSVHYRGNPIPLLYVVDGNSGDVMKCSVENITVKNGVYSSEKIQELHLNQSGFEKAGYMTYWGWPAWLVSSDGEYLWLHGARYRTNGSMDEYYSDNRYIITKFRLPSTDKAVVVLTSADVVEQIVTEYNVNFTQGGTVSGKYLFYTFGTGKSDNPSAIRVWDLENGKLLGPVDVSSVEEELEDCCVVGDKLYFITQKSNLYCINVGAAVSQ